jgi:hypothetical protein
MLPLVGLLGMLFGRGPNNWRRLMRLDLAALLVLTAGVALAFAIVRGLDPLEAAWILVLALPAMIAFAWLGRYALEELAIGFGRKRDRHEQSADLSFLKDPPQDEIIEANIVDPPCDDAPP